MIALIKKILGIKTTDYNALMEEGAVIIDVRTVREFKGGKINKATNIPLDKISGKLKAIQKLNKPVIFCCASGARSGQATSLAKAKGINAYNGGGWRSLNSKLQ